MTRDLFRFSRISVVLSISLLFAAHTTHAQHTEQKAAMTLSTKIAQSSNGALSLAQTHADGTAKLLLADPDRAQPILSSATATATTAGQSAMASFRQVATDILGVPAEAELTEVSTTRAAALWVTNVAMSFDGIPVRDKFAQVATGAITGKLVTVRTDLPLTTPSVTSPVLSLNDVTARVTNTFPANAKVVGETKLTYVAQDDELTLCYEVNVSETTPEVHAWRVTIDATTGEVIEKKDLIEYDFTPELTKSAEPQPAAPLQLVKGRVLARVHPKTRKDSTELFPMPYQYVTVNGTQVTTDSAGYWQLETIAPVVFAGGLSGPFSRTTNAGGITANVSANILSPYDFVWDTGNSDQAERDVFYHVGRIRNHVRSIDPNLTNLDDMIALNVNLSQVCNAFYNPQDVSLNFFAPGSGCANTGEIADVIYHEFGHRVVHARYAKAGKGYLNDGSLGEGFADLVSALYRDDPKIGQGFFTTSSSLLRTCDNNAKWPTGINSDIHVTGEIVAGAVWDLRKTMGLRETEQLFHDALYLTPDGDGTLTERMMQESFASVLAAMLTTDDDDNNLKNGTPHASLILAAFRKHGITLSPMFAIDVVPTANQSATASAYTVRAKVVYSGTVGSLDENVVKLRYSTDGKKYESVDMRSEGNGMFQATLPQQPDGTFVRYYISAATTLGADHYVNSPDSLTPNSFLVGYTPLLSDNCETLNGWSLSATADKATTGLWALGDPKLSRLRQKAVQLDTDHTANGTSCYVTGNTAQSTNTSTDDVDGGRVTLTTPLLDLSETNAPVIRYWYFFRNDAGQYTCTEHWTVSVSGDSGKTWKKVHDTQRNTRDWTPFAFRVSDYVTPSKNTLVRFVTQDNGTTVANAQINDAVVEAGVDDLEVYSGPQSTAAVSTPTHVADLKLSVYPSPARSTSHVSIQLDVPQSEHYVLKIKNLLGETVAEPIDSYLNSGEHTTHLELSALPEGTFWAELSSPTGYAVKRFTVIR